MAVVKTVASLKAVNEGLFFCSTHLIGAAVFLAFSLSGNVLTSQIIFTTISLFSILQVRLHGEPLRACAVDSRGCVFGVST